jgi:peptidoglycan/xylan/chitin deacetylase (PgdA/CDA1 family)
MLNTYFNKFEIGSHGFEHKKITGMSTDEKWKELNESKKILEDEFKKPIHSYAFTYGDANSEARELAQKAGYDYALNTDTGAMNLEQDPHSVFRVSIFPEENYFSLWKKTSKWYRRYYKWKRHQ